MKSEYNETPQLVELRDQLFARPTQKFESTLLWVGSWVPQTFFSPRFNGGTCPHAGGKDRVPALAWSSVPTLARLCTSIPQVSSLSRWVSAVRWMSLLLCSGVDSIQRQWEGRFKRKGSNSIQVSSMQKHMNDFIIVNMRGQGTAFYSVITLLKHQFFTT